MITFMTGATGSGKTLRAIWLGMKLKKQLRRVFVLGSREPPVDGVNDAPDADGWYPGIRGLDFQKTGFIPFNKDLSDWREIGKGGVLIVDEAQRWLHRDRVPSKMPEWLEAMTRNRQYGLDLIFITQDPRFLHSMARRLCNYHEHVVRRFGLQMATIYRWESLCEDVSRQSWRKRATVEVWKYPREVFGYYVSSEEHTVQRKIPMRLYLTGASLVVAVALVWFAWHLLMKPTHSQTGAVASASADSAGGGLSSIFSRGGSRVVHQTADEYVKERVPRVAGMPWSAPVFDDRKVASEPDVLCVVSEVKGCRCYTEQITPLDVPLLQCFQIAHHGIYNPYRKPLESVASAPPPASASSPAVAAPLPSSSYRQLPAPSVVPDALRVRPAASR